MLWSQLVLQLWSQSSLLQGQLWQQVLGHLAGVAESGVSLKVRTPLGGALVAFGAGVCFSSFA